MGCAQAIVNGSAAWLGNIVVRPEYRCRGIGYQLTRDLVEILRLKGCTCQILTATRLGEPIYRRLGFAITSEYIFFRREDPMSATASRIRRMNAADELFVFALDRTITGEDRCAFLRQFLSGAWVHESTAGKVDGFFLPQMALGPVLADNDEAGLDLLRFRISQGRKNTVVPDSNAAAVAFLRSNGFVETDRAPRMALGEDVDWRPTLVFSRGSGYAG